MSRKNTGPTVVDIARLAGVSTSTAARVLRHSDYPVDPKLRELVLAAATGAGYVPNLQARNLRRGDPGFIGLIVGSISDSFFGDIAQAVTERARKHAMLAIVANMQRDPELELEFCRNLWEHRVAGLILSGGSFDQFTHAPALADLVDRMVAGGTPVISLATRHLSVPTFSVDNYQVGIMLAEHVLGFGHRDIGIAFGPPNTVLNQVRLQGLTDTFRAAGSRFTVEYAEPYVAAGGAAAEALLAQHPNLTAIVAGGDMLAIGVLERLRYKGRKIPDEVSVTGIGNTPYARLVEPRLTTVDVGIANAGTAAVDYIWAAARAGDSQAPIEISAVIVPGASLARAPQTPGGR